MQKPDRALKRDFARAHADHLAAHAAQFRKRLAGRPASAIDDDFRTAERFAGDAEPDLAAFRAQSLGQSGQCDARIEMAFVSEEQALVKAPGEIGLERCDPRAVDALMAGGARREPVDLACVARRRDDQRAFALDARNARIPPVDRALAELNHASRGALALAERRQHAARQP